MIVGVTFICDCVSFKKSFKSALVSLFGLVICSVSMMGVYGVLGECMLMGDKDISKMGWVVRVWFGTGELAAFWCIGVFAGVAGLLCFLNLFRLSSRSWRN
jgi:hypothetical protein